MSGQTKKLLFSNPEFIMLSMLLGTDKIIGFDDAEGIAQMDEEQLAGKWSEVKQGLQEKGYIKEETDDSLQIEEDVCSLINHYINSDRYLQILIAKKGMDISDEFLFFVERESINFTVSPDDNGVTGTIANGSFTVKQILQRYIDVSGEIEKIIVTGNKAVLSKARYYEFMSYMNLGELAKFERLLADAGMDENAASDAAECFLNKEEFVNITGVSVSNPTILPWMMMFLFGKHSIFSMNVNENCEETFILTAMDKNDFWETISDAVDERLV